MIKFRSVLERYESSELNQCEAAELLGISERTFRRWQQRYDESGESGLLDRRLGRASGKRVPVDREAEVERLHRTRYSGFTNRTSAEAMPASGARTATSSSAFPTSLFAVPFNLMAGREET